MSLVRTFICLAAAAMLINSATAATFIVGGPTGGWDITTNLRAWSSSQVFSVGDSLTFQYTPNHNVVEVSKEDYDACQSTNPIQVYSSGTTPIPLISPGSRYFICGAGAHCSLGMKVEIATLAASATSPASSPEPTALPSGSPSIPGYFSSPGTLISQPPASRGPSPTTLPSFPLTGSPQSFNPVTASSPEPTALPSGSPSIPGYLSSPGTLISQPPASRGPSPTTLPSFPLTGSPQSFNPVTAISTEPPPFSAAKMRTASSLGFALLMFVLLFL